MSDRELTDLLALAAGVAPAPSGAAPVPDDDEPAASAPSASRRRWLRPLAAAAAVAVGLAVGAQVLDDPSPDEELTDQGDDSAGPVPASTPSGVGTGSATGGSGATSSPGSQAVPTPTRIVHTGSIRVEVEEGAFAATMERVTTITAGLGGFVAATETSEQDDAPSGSLTVRVPAAGFEALVAEVRRLGDVQSLTTSGNDVTAQYVDLEARLGALRATRDQFLAVLGEAEAIGDILAVQDRINIVNVEIESLEGQRRYLEDQSGFGTLTVAVTEPGADDPVEVAEERGDGGLGGAWEEARRGFGNAVEWFVARSGKALVLAVAALAVLALGQIALRRLRRTTL